VANTLWSYATLGHDPGAQLLDAIAAHMCDRMHVFRPQAISNSLWVRACAACRRLLRCLRPAAHASDAPALQLSRLLLLKKHALQYPCIRSLRAQRDYRLCKTIAYGLRRA